MAYVQDVQSHTEGARAYPSMLRNHLGALKCHAAPCPVPPWPRSIVQQHATIRTPPRTPHEMHRTCNSSSSGCGGSDLPRLSSLRPQCRKREPTPHRSSFGVARLGTPLRRHTRLPRKRCSTSPLSSNARGDTHPPPPRTNHSGDTRMVISLIPTDKLISRISLALSTTVRVPSPNAGQGALTPLPVERITSTAHERHTLRYLRLAPRRE